jgi:RNA polymerase sigma-70 factor (ECF subfamily)
MSLDPMTGSAIVQAIPSIRAFAISLCRNRDRADDLVQETLTRAIANIDSFTKGSNLEAWLITILRYGFYNECRKLGRTCQGADEVQAEAGATPPDQVGWGIAQDLRAGFGALSHAHRQALFLVGVSGLSYEDAALAAGCPVGTMKSRVSHARKDLATFMSRDIGTMQDLGRNNMKRRNRIPTPRSACATFEEP